MSVGTLWPTLAMDKFACLPLRCELVNLLSIGISGFRTYSILTSIGDFPRFLQALHQVMASFWNLTPRWRYHTQILGTKREWKLNSWTSSKGNSLNCRLESVVSWAINFPSIYNISYYYYSTVFVNINTIIFPKEHLLSTLIDSLGVPLIEKEARNAVL